MALSHKELRTDFMSKLNSLITLLEKKSVTENERALVFLLRQRISTVAQINGVDFIPTECATMLYQYDKEIIERKEEFFLQTPVKDLISSASAALVDESTTELIELVRGVYTKSPKSERDRVYKMVLDLHKVGIQYLLVGV
jgi:hypothetical protein